jgi:hypothetical protein
MYYVVQIANKLGLQKKYLYGFRGGVCSEYCIGKYAFFA